MMGRVYAIAINTFREAVRDRVLHGVLAFATAVLFFTLALAELSLDEERRIVLDVGLASISLFSVLVAIFLGSSLLYQEIQRKTLYVILPRPIRRWEFLLGKYLGIALTALVFIAVMGAVHFEVAALQAGTPFGLAVGVPIVLVLLLGLALWRASDRTAVVIPWSIVAVITMAVLAATAGLQLGPVVVALLLTFVEVLVLSAVAMVFSAFSTPFLTGVLTLGVWLVGRSADEMVTVRASQVTPEVKAVLRALAEVLPNFSLFVPGRHTLETYAAGHGDLWIYLAKTAGYGALYASALLVLASLVFHRRDFL